MIKTIEQRLLARTTENANGCWECSYRVDGHGYPQIAIGKTLFRTARMAYQLWIGIIKEGFYVCHSCDNRKCINPEHLWLGTHQDNMSDMVRKGRHGKCLGTKNGRSKLNPEQIAYIRLRANEGFSAVSIAKTFKISNVQVKNIVIKKHWRHIL